MGQKNAEVTKGHSRFYRVWLRQNGLCSTCQKPITKLTHWNAYYYVKKVDGEGESDELIT